MTAPKSWEDVLVERGEPVLPGAAYDCPTCESIEHAFAIVRGPDGEWRCSACRVPDRVDDPPELDWNDVRGQRAVFLERTDWSQLPDVPEATRDAWRPLRQRARDLTDAPDPAAALELLRALLEDASAV